MHNPHIVINICDVEEGWGVALRTLYHVSPWHSSPEAGTLSLSERRLASLERVRPFLVAR